KDGCANIGTNAAHQLVDLDRIWCFCCRISRLYLGLLPHPEWACIIDTAGVRDCRVVCSRELPVCARFDDAVSIAVHRDAAGAWCGVIRSLLLARRTSTCSC